MMIPTSTNWRSSRRLISYKGNVILLRPVFGWRSCTFVSTYLCQSEHFCKIGTFETGIFKNRTLTFGKFDTCDFQVLILEQTVSRRYWVLMRLNTDWRYKWTRWNWVLMLLWTDCTRVRSDDDDDVQRWVGTSRWEMWCWDGRIVGGFSVGKTTWRSRNGGGGTIDWLLTDVRLSMLSIKLKCDIEKLILCGMNELLPVVWWNDCMCTLRLSKEKSLIPSRRRSTNNPELHSCPVTEAWSCHRPWPGERLILFVWLF